MRATGNVTQCNWCRNTEVIDGVEGTYYMREQKYIESLTSRAQTPGRLCVHSNASCYLEITSLSFIVI